MPAKPRWLLAIPDAIRQLEKLDQDLLTRRDRERLFGVSKVRAVALMTAFGAGRTGHILTLPRAELLRQLRRHRKRAAFRGEETRRERVVTEIRKARLTGIRVAVPVEGSRRAFQDCRRAWRSSPIGSRCASAARRTPSDGSSRWPRRLLTTTSGSRRSSEKERRPAAGER